MKSIYLRLVGGLGNQMYQFSFAIYLKEKLGYDKIVIDTSGMKNYNENWGFLLFDVLDENKISEFVLFESCIIHKLRLAKVLSFFPKLSSYLGLLSDSNVNLMNKLSGNHSIYLDGYFEKVDFRHNYKVMISEYLRRDLLVEVPEDALIINVRGGEYAKLGLSGVDDLHLYKSYINDAKKRLNINKYYLVTDDKDFAKSMFDGFIDFEYIFPQDAFENFRVLYSARNKVLSRSTFAKWAGELSDDFSYSYKMGKF